MKLQIVQFTNGKFAVRKRRGLSHVYLDAQDRQYWWGLDSAEGYCLLDTYEEAAELKRLGFDNREKPKLKVRWIDK